MNTPFAALPWRRLARPLSILCMLVPLAQAHARNVADLIDKNWIEIDSPNFRVVTEQPEDVARRMIVDLENLRYISNRVRGAQSLDGPPLTIVAQLPDAGPARELGRRLHHLAHRLRGPGADRQLREVGGRKRFFARDHPARVPPLPAALLARDDVVSDVV